MKFGKQLQLGMYAPWSEHYIAYDRLKRLIDRKVFLKKKMEAKRLRLEAKARDSPKPPVDIETAITEMTPLTSGDKQDSFWQAEDSDSHSFIFEVDKELVRINNFFSTQVLELRVQLDELVEKWKEQHASHHNVPLLSSHLVEFRHLFLSLTALAEYGPLNRTGFYKIVKKYDKNMNEKTVKTYMLQVDAQTFVTSQEPRRLIDVVAGYVSRSKLVEWQHASIDASSHSHSLFPSLRPHALAVSVIIFIVSFQLPAVADDNPHASRCLSLLLLVTSLWLTNAMPYFATAMLVPVMIPLLGVMREPGGRHADMSSEEAAKFILNSFFNHSTILMFGGYTLSCALSTCQFELRVAAWLQKKLGHSPALFLLAIMFFGLVLSMWISNHTAPIIVASILRPIVQDLHKDSSFAKALLLGLAYSCNFGGMMSPISSLQNILAVANLEKIGVDISFMDWMLVSIPFASLCTLVSWAFVCAVYRPGDVTAIPIVVYDRENKPFSVRNLTVMVVSLVTMLCFACFDLVKPLFGDIGMVALLYACFMFGTGILTELDFNSLSWHTLFLLAGGSALGKAVESSGLLKELSLLILAGIPTDSQWLALLYVLVFAALVATFVSHTVASMILMPMVAQVGVDMHMPRVMIMGVAFAVSASMALPFSSFPNVNSVQILDDFQSPFLTTADFIKTGLPLTLLSLLGISTVAASLIHVFVGGSWGDAD